MYTKDNVNKPLPNGQKPWSPKTFPNGQKPTTTTSNTRTPKLPLYQKLALEWAMKQGENNTLSNTPSNTPQKYSKFASLLEATNTQASNLNSNYTYTLNGDLAYKSTLNPLVDLNSHLPNYRTATPQKITQDFRAVFAYNPLYALSYLFYSRDIRQGAGERLFFRTVIVDLAKNGLHDFVNSMIPMIPEYGRYDDLWPLLDCSKCKSSVLKFIKTQLKSDMKARKENKPCSILPKWLPSNNTSSKQTRHYASIIVNYLGWTYSQYQHTLSTMRAYIDVLERKMSANQWESIDYEHVPSQANKIYSKAFLKHDPERRQLYLDALSQGKAKVNASVLTPPEIAHKYVQAYCTCFPNRDSEIQLVNNLWKNLPDTISNSEISGDTICVVDTSGSMGAPAGGWGSKNTTTCREVAYSLGIYFAERNHGVFKDKMITFSRNAKYMDVSGYEKFSDKFNYFDRECIIENTNIESVFNLILDTAVNNNLTQDEIPARVLVLSDNQFDPSQLKGTRAQTTFQRINNLYASYGYKMPMLVFWCIGSYSNVPVTTYEDFPCALVSGYSANIFKMVLSGKTDPLSVILDVILTERYSEVKRVWLKTVKGWSSRENKPRTNRGYNSKGYSSKVSTPIKKPRKS